ncbi:MAG TPA: acyltransferase [Novosphingobium sp.]|nr:acyltransferase [Novosphingobium sp.]
MNPPAPARLDQLTSLRFFAALAVLASHLWPLAEEPNLLQPVARTLFFEGFAGVSFFFMLSGFILAHTYQAKLATGAISKRKYLALRIARIAPLHWLVAAPFAVAALVAGGLAEAPKVGLNLALLQSWVPDADWYFTLNEPSWSLSDEAFFYVCFAFLAFWPVRRLGLLAAGLLLADGAVAAWRVAGGHGAILVDGRNTFTHWLTYIDPAARLLDFVWGMLLYRLPRKGGSTWLEALALALLFDAMASAQALGLAEAWRMQLAYLPYMALLIWTFAQGGGWFSRVLARTRWLVLLGDASFALYLVHLPVVHAGLWLQDRLDEAALPWLPWAAGVSMIAIALSVAVYRWVEVPLLRASRRWIDAVFAR